jgi:outer membrane protein assembly factor BamB
VRWWKVVLPLVVVVALVAAAVVAAYRWARPGEWVTETTGAYPAPAAMPLGLVAELRAIPLVVDRRLRVFATKHDVWAERLAAPDGQDAYWSYHRFPAEVTGVVVASAHGDDPPIVAVKWSTGNLVGIDARTGRVAWRHTVENLYNDEDWLGGPTGVATLYGHSLLGLFTAHDARGEPAIISAGEHGVQAFRPATGHSLWRNEFSGCAGVSWTGETVFAVVLACDQPKTIHFYDAGTGREVGTWRPAEGSKASQTSWILVGRLGCRAALSECSGFAVSDDGGTWLLGHDGSVAALPKPSWQLVLTDQMMAWVGDDRRTIRAVSVPDGKELWRYTSSEQISDLTRDGAAVYALTKSDRLLRLDSRTGDLVTNLALPRGADDSFHVYADSGYVIIDRSNFDFTNRNADWSLPRSARPVLLVATGA